MTLRTRNLWNKTKHKQKPNKFKNSIKKIKIKHVTTNAKKLTHMEAAKSTAA